MTLANEAALMPKDAALEDLRVAVGAYNDARPGVARAMHIRILLIFGGYLVFAAVVVYALWQDRSTDLLGIVLGLLAVGAVFVWGFATGPAKRFQQSLRDRLLPIVFGFIDDVRYGHGAEPHFMRAMPGKDFVPRDRSVHGDTIAGAHDGLAFTLSETEMSTGSGKSKQTTFKGVIFHFLRDDAFPGLLLAARKPNAMQRFMRDFFRSSSLSLVTSGNPEVDATHEFRSDRPEAATPIVQGTLAKALDYLATEWRDDVVRLALAGRDCYLLVPAKKDFFELPPVDTAIDFDRHIRPMIRDLVMLLATAQLVRKIG